MPEIPACHLAADSYRAHTSFQGGLDGSIPSKDGKLSIPGMQLPAAATSPVQHLPIGITDSEAMVSRAAETGSPAHLARDASSGCSSHDHSSTQLRNRGLFAATAKPASLVRASNPVLTYATSIIQESAPMCKRHQPSTRQLHLGQPPAPCAQHAYFIPARVLFPAKSYIVPAASKFSSLSSTSEPVRQPAYFRTAATHSSRAPRVSHIDFVSKFQAEPQWLADYAASQQTDASSAGLPDHQAPQALPSLQAQSSCEEGLLSDDSVAISPRRRQAWDWSHGSLQSFRALRQRLQNDKWQAGPNADEGDDNKQQMRSADTVVCQENSQQIRQGLQYVWPDSRPAVIHHQQYEAPQPAQQPAHQPLPSSCLLPPPVLPAPTPQPQPQPQNSSPTPQHPPWCSSASLQVPLQCSSSSSSLPSWCSSSARWGAASPPPWYPKVPCTPPSRSSKMTERLPHDYGMTHPMSRVMAEEGHSRMHAAQLEDLQHSTLDWMAANFTGAGVTCRQA